MKVNELMDNLTKEYVGWDQMAAVCVRKKNPKSGMDFHGYGIDRVSLYAPIWEHGDICQLVLFPTEKDQDGMSIWHRKEEDRRTGKLATVRDLVHILTKKCVNWNSDAFIYVKRKNSFKPDAKNKLKVYDIYDIDQTSLFAPIWRRGDKCQLVFLQHKHP